MDSLWILTKRSGLLIFEKEFNKNVFDSKVSADLISGFFSAIDKFFYTVFSEGIQKIQFYERTLYFKSTKELIFVSCFNKKKKLSESKIDKFLSKIKKNFYQEFHNFLENNENIYNKTKFYSFSKKLENIVKIEPSPGNILSLF